MSRKIRFVDFLLGGVMVELPCCRSWTDILLEWYVTRLVEADWCAGHEPDTKLCSRVGNA